MSFYNVYVPANPAQAWVDMRSQCVTNFILPHHNADFNFSSVTKESLDHFPFEKFCISETFTLDQSKIPPDHKLYIPHKTFEVANGIEETVLWKESENTIGIVSKIRYFDGAIPNGVVYVPNKETLKNKDELLNAFELYFRFFRYLNNKASRYVERPVSRQVRRSLNVDKNYSEYVIVSWEDIRYAHGSPKTEIMKRMQSLHRVRGHLRLNYRTGEKTIKVRPYIRGEGSTLVDKDYLIK